MKANSPRKPTIARAAGASRTASAAGLTLLLIAALSLLPACRGQSERAASSASDYPIRPVPFTQVTLADDFWAVRLDRTVD